MYVILTSKPGRFHTQPGSGMTVVQAYDYVFYGQTRAVFEIAALEAPSRVAIIEDEPPHTVNHVSTKFLESFATLDAALAELHHLIRFGSMDAQLVRTTSATTRSE
ncbi:Uncharacterised protein [Bordetella ansorpii]|uniref:Uncharacterized protein n=1 Tax=Bordetella ansorpii TaxID=288768 RepID=A0A157QXS8_9BORD|nr:ferredoxin [Bordetella ansorpii]SAI50510.1 Uncharacterised protein [Bordetella ansorpii]